MKISLKLIVLLALVSFPAQAQDTPSLQISAGYTFRSLAPTMLPGSTLPRLSTNGWNAGADYGLRRRLGLALSLDGTYKNNGVNGNTSLYSFYVGPRIYPFGHRKLTFFAHLLFGGAYGTIRFPASGGFPASSLSDTSFAFDGGGGLDVSLRHHWGVRFFQLDYESTKLFAGSGTTRKSNYKVSAGIVYRFSKK